MFQHRYMINFLTALFENFSRANGEGLFITKINNIVLLNAGIFHSGGPLMILLWNWICDTLSDDLWVHPFKGVLVAICISELCSPLIEIIHAASFSTTNRRLATFSHIFWTSCTTFTLHVISVPWTRSMWAVVCMVAPIWRMLPKRSVWWIRIRVRDVWWMWLRATPKRWSEWIESHWLC